MLNLLSIFLFVHTVLASPLGLANLAKSHACSVTQSQSCNVSQYSIPLPGNQTTLVVPPGEVPTLITLGRGIQNYTCTSGAWVNIGALAK